MNICTTRIKLYRSPVLNKRHIKEILKQCKNTAHFKELNTRYKDACKAVEDLRSDIHEYFKNSSLSHSTREKYVSTLCNLTAILDTPNVTTILKNPRYIHQINMDSIYTRWTYISRILSVFKYSEFEDIGNKWSDASKTIADVHLTISRSNAPTNSSQVRNFVPMKAWKELPESVSNNHDTYYDSLISLFIAYVCNIPPKRGEMGKIIISDPYEKFNGSIEHNKPNYIQNNELHMTHHKTSKRIIQICPDAFMKVLKKSLRKWPRRYLFTDAQNDPMTPEYFSTWVRRLTMKLFHPKSPGINLIRHSYCTALDFNKLTGNDRDEIAKMMGHSVHLQDRYRFIIN